MKLPVIRQIQRTATVEEIEATIKVLEHIAEAGGVKPEEVDVIGEIISNCCGALEVHQLIADGMPEKDAANSFMQKVLGSIDR